VSEFTPPSSNAPTPSDGSGDRPRKKIVRIRLVPRNPDSPIEAMKAIKGPDSAPCTGVPESAPLAPDAERNLDDEARATEKARGALARQQARRALEAAAMSASHVTAAMIEARTSGMMAAGAAWNELLFRSKSIVKTGGKIAYDVFVKVAADILREMLTGKH
jgi:hypothetical protein